MKKWILVTAVLLLATVVSAQNQTRWATTRDHQWVTTGECRLEKSTIRVNLTALAVNVEEEAVISTIRPDWWTADRGDSSTLEITGEFVVAAGTTVRSMLLWNGNALLKAKLKDRIAAQNEYEEMVDRERPVVIARDPAIIEYIGNNTYRYRIYPVALGASRRIRILYTIPLTAFTNGVGFDVQPLFLYGCSNQTPSMIPVTFTADTTDTTDTSTWFFEDGIKRREITAGGTYVLPVDLFSTLASYSYYYSCKVPRPLRIVAKSPGSSWAKQCMVPEGTTAGTYIALVLPVNSILSAMIAGEKDPDSLYRALTGVEPPDGDPVSEERIANVRSVVSIEASVNTGGADYILETSGYNFVLAFIKSSGTWDREVNWRVFNVFGEKVLNLKQFVVSDDDTGGTGLLPLLWAGKYSFREKAGDLGGTYGFVDTKMSLCALEDDVLSDDDAKKFETAGVPALLPEEILPGKAGGPIPPEESAIFEFGVGTVTASKLLYQQFVLRLLKGHVLEMIGDELGEASDWNLELFDLSGRVLFRMSNIHPVNHTVRISLPRTVRGTCLVRMTAGKHRLTRQLSIR